MFMTLAGLSELKTWLDNHQLSSSSIDSDTLSSVTNIQKDVIAYGDDAICKLTLKFDNVSISKNQLKITQEEIQSAYNFVDQAYVTALKNAAKNIEKYHKNQRPLDWEKNDNGNTYGVQYKPLEAVGLYVPGGRAAYPSTVLMTAIPAKIAGCKRLVMVSPPTGGKIPPSVLVAADLAGVDEIYQVGGAQSVFALAYGTTTIKAVDKIVGPGNRFVTAAKQMVYGVVDIDKPAGPSEVCVLIDDITYANYAAAEMFAQLEHDPDASAICLVNSEAMANAVNNAATQQFSKLNRQAIINESKSNASIVVCSSHSEQLEAVNYCASEHLVLISEDANEIRQNVDHAGSIFCGPFTPVTLGDYYAGPNHVLPTTRSARFASPLGVMDFMKYSSYLTYTKESLTQVYNDIHALTSAEGFDAHFQAVKVRVDDN